MTAPKNSLAEQVRKLAGDAVGGLGGTAVGLLLGGPGGALVGGASGPLLAEGARRVFGDLTGRFLSRREEARIADAAFFAAREIATRLENGDRLREDGFFNVGDNGRSDAEEIFEGVLIKCKNEHEERKAPYLGCLFSNVAFSNVSGPNANAIIKLAERMSYRQLCILSLCVQEKEFGFDNMEFLRLRRHATNEAASYLFTEWRELRSEGIGVVEPEKSGEGPSIEPTTVGHASYGLLGLSKIPREDIERLIGLIRASSK